MGREKKFPNVDLHPMRIPYFYKDQRDGLVELAKLLEERNENLKWVVDRLSPFSMQDIEYKGDRCRYRQRYRLYEANVAAGFDGASEEDFDAARYTEIEMNECLGDPNNVSLHRVSGDSMIDYGIFSKDLVAVRAILDPSCKPRSGSIVLARYNHAYTIKEYIKTNNDELLVPHNSDTNAYPTRSVRTAEDFCLKGIAFKLIRDL